MNDLTITARNDVIKEIVDSKLQLQKLFPCPQELLETTAPAEYNAKDKVQYNIEKYGHPDWYNWQISNWGTKWDIGPVELDYDMNCSDNLDGTSTLTVGFDSAWSPPVAAMGKLYEKFKDKNIQIRLEYFEPGCAFLGVAYTVNEKFVDECYDYEGADDLESYVNDLDHNLASSEVEYLREIEEEERQEKLSETAKKESKKLVKKPAKKLVKKPAKKLVKKPAKKAAKKPAKKAAKKPAKKADNKPVDKKRFKKI
jgi:hypothetical protein